MAVTTSKVTYSLKPETVDRVQELATAWGVPKSEVLTSPGVITSLMVFA